MIEYHETTKTALALGALLLSLIFFGCGKTDDTPGPNQRYASFSRFTDPGEQSTMLDSVPEDPMSITAVASHLTVHHNLLTYFDIPKERWPDIKAVWPPKAPDILEVVAKSGPKDLLGERPLTDRVRGACMLESHLLATMLRYRRFPVRLRAGYFRDVYTNEDHLIAFWERNSRAKGVAKQLLESDPEKWLEVNHDYTRQQVAANKCVEHWVVEYWDSTRKGWRLLDANNVFLKAMSGIEVGYALPRRYFEYAYESWRKMRTAERFNPDQYAEWPQDGRSHIRSQLLWDFYSLLNHDIAGYDKTLWGDADSASAERKTYGFVKEKKYDELVARELEELDALAELMATDPSIKDLVAFYHGHNTLHIQTIDTDQYSFVWGQGQKH